MKRYKLQHKFKRERERIWWIKSVAKDFLGWHGYVVVGKKPKIPNMFRFFVDSSFAVYEIISAFKVEKIGKGDTLAEAKKIAEYVLSLAAK